MMSMMPNTRVRPAAIRNSINPNCRPFSNCSTINVNVMKHYPRVAYARTGRPRACLAGGRRPRGRRRDLS
ncbi:Uncharacterised protein [Bordetella pertussis]|nr:Uncharacterised protein [Bordetella pertussis]CFV98630.1 Uncharacterised protein [Bordetella pertussis]